MGNFLNEFFGRKKKPEQSKADAGQSQSSGGTARTENRQPTGPAEPNSEKAGHRRDPARGEEGETPGTWNPEQGCLEVETERVLELRSLSTVMIKLTKGEVLVLETDKV